MAVLGDSEVRAVVDRVVAGGRLQDNAPLGPGLQQQVDCQQKHSHPKHHILLQPHYIIYSAATLQTMYIDMKGYTVELGE